MKHLNTATLLAVLAAGAALGGCATDGPATNGDAVRALVAAQIVPPPAQRARAVGDGAAAVETYKNYVESYNTPQPQLNDSAFRR